MQTKDGRKAPDCGYGQIIIDEENERRYKVATFYPSLSLIAASVLILFLFSKCQTFFLEFSHRVTLICTHILSIPVRLGPRKADLNKYVSVLLVSNI